MVVLPAPEGEDRMNIKPRRWSVSEGLSEPAMRADGAGVVTESSFLGFFASGLGLVSDLCRAPLFRRAHPVAAIEQRFGE